MDEEWYMWSYRTKTHLHDKALVHRPYTSDDHDHCEICWARFSKHLEDLQIGYYEPNSNSWICEDCFTQLHLLFGWKTNIDTKD